MWSVHYEIKKIKIIRSKTLCDRLQLQMETEKLSLMNGFSYNNVQNVCTTQ